MAAKSRPRTEQQAPTPAPVETPRALGYRMPAEWEPHAATWLAWPHQQTDWPGKFASVPWVFAEIAKKLSLAERVRLIVRDRAMKKQALASLDHAGVDCSQVDVFESETNRSWTRDFVPSFVVGPSTAKQRSKKPKPGAGRVLAVKFRFNGWARYANHRADEASGQRVAEWLEIPQYSPNFPLRGRQRPFVLEGGAIDVDGEGTLLTTEECLLDGKQARNRELGREGCERVLAEALGIEKVLWVERGIAGDDTGGHIDDFARFAGPGTIVLAEEKRRADANHKLLEAARERLERARDARGRRIRLVRLPMPEPLAFAGQRLPASYANFYVANRHVLVPTFNDPLDRVALGILGELFPDREVVGIHAVDLVLGLGTIHCSTQQEPQGG